MSTEKEYEVNWGMVYLATSPLDAVRQAIGDLAFVIAQPAEGPNVFLVRCTEDANEDRSFIAVGANDVYLDPVEED